MSQTASTELGLPARLCIGGVDGLPWAVEALLLGARIYAGVTIASAGLDKLPVPDWMVEQVAQMGFPAVGFFALVACLTEFAGGVTLVFGLLTRPSAALLAFTMGTAAFRFHGVAPFTGMHIAQGFFWLFVVFVALGGGRLSVDHVLRRVGSRSPAGAALAAAVLALGPTTYGLYLNYGPRPAPADPAPVEMTSMSVPGSFNDWVLSTHALQRQADGTWAGILVFVEAGPITFKFAANGSWDVNLGDDDPGTAGFPVAGSGEPGGQNVSVYIPGPGRYRFAVDPVDFSYRVEAGDEPEIEPDR